MRPTKETKAKLIQEINKISDSLYQVQEYDYNNTIIMTGEFSSINPMLIEGGEVKVICYVYEGQDRERLMCRVSHPIARGYSLSAMAHLNNMHSNYILLNIETLKKTLIL